MGLHSLALGMLIAACAAGQTLAPTGDLKFEVASFKPSPPDAVGRTAHPESGGTRYVGFDLPLKLYLTAAFQVDSEQIAGPAWLDTERYELNAKAPKPSTLEELHIMLQNLLIERMKLRYHIERKEMPAYVLSVVKRGPKNLTLHPDARGSDFSLERTVEQLIHVKWTAHCAPMSLLTSWLDQEVHTPVVDNTGLQGCWDFQMTFLIGPAPVPGKETQMINGVPVDTSGPRIFDALEEQLGLKLESKRAPVDTMVVDYAEQPDWD